MRKRFEKGCYSVGVAERNTASHGLPYRYIIKKIVTKKRGVEHDRVEIA